MKKTQRHKTLASSIGLLNCIFKTFILYRKDLKTSTPICFTSLYEQLKITSVDFLVQYLFTGEHFQLFLTKQYFMKAKTLILVLLSLAFLQGQSTENDIITKLKKANVFLNGAQLNRTAKIQVKSGIQDYTILGLSADVDPNSISIKGKGAYTIIGVKHRLNYLSAPKLTPEIQKLRDSIRIYTNLDERNLQIQNAYQEEKSMILQNKVIKSQNQNLDVLELQKLADFYRSRMQDINLSLLDLSKKDQHYKKRIQLLHQQESQIRAAFRKTTSEVVLTILAKANTSGSLELSYKINDAGWIPSYDVRSKNGSDQINIKYKATVYQTTGEDWKNVKLTLSTGQLNTNNTLPSLSPWYIQYYTAYKKRRSNSKSRSIAAPSMVAESYDAEMEDELAVASLAQFTKIIESQFNTEFTIGLPLTIKSNAEGQMMAITDYKLPVQYRYLTIPKINNSAYLLARISGWEDLYLLPGEMSLYNQDTYIGKSYLDPAKTIDTLELSMGKDQFVSVERKMIKDHNKNVIFGSNRKLNKGFEITIKNAKSKAIEIVIMDQIPISSLSEIIVKLEEDGGANLNKNNGFMSWNLELKSKASFMTSFIYSVKFPKDKRITNLN